MKALKTISIIIMMFIVVMVIIWLGYVGLLWLRVNAQYHLVSFIVLATFILYCVYALFKSIYESF